MTMTPTEARTLVDTDIGLGLTGSRSFAPLLRHRRIAAALRLLPALVPALLFLPMVLSPPLNHDVAAVLEFAQRWLSGEHLYSDLIDVNPPLIFLLNLVPAWLASVTPLEPVQALQLCLLAYGGLCWYLSRRVRDRAAEGPAERVLLDVFPALLLLGAGYDFGQREHLMVVGAFPYVLCAARRRSGERPSGRFASALVAAVALAIKPHFLAVAAAVELAVVIGRCPRGAMGGSLATGLRASLRDPVPWIMAAVWLVYLASLPVVFPDYLEVVLPLVWNYYVDLGGMSAVQMLLVPRLATALGLLIPLLVLAFRPGRARPWTPAPSLPPVLGAAALGALVSAVAQHKGWSYHILPVEQFAAALGTAMAARWMDRLGVSVAPGASPTAIAATLTALCALYAVSNGEAPWKELGYPSGEVEGLTRLLGPDAAGERVLVLSPGIYPIYPALDYVGAHNSLRTMNTWLLQGAYRECLPDGRRYREVWEMGRPEFFVYRTVAEDFARAPPAAVLVDRQPGIPWCGGEFDFVAYFDRHPLFAEVWSHYQLSAQWDRYRLYTRKD